MNGLLITMSTVPTLLNLRKRIVQFWMSFGKSDSQSPSISSMSTGVKLTKFAEFDFSSWQHIISH